MTAIPSLGFALKKPSAKPINYIAAIYSGVNYQDGERECMSSGVAEVQCESCSNTFTVDGGDLYLEQVGAESRRMGMEIFYEGEMEIQCPRCASLIGLKLESSEYPIGFEGDSELSVYGADLIRGGHDVDVAFDNQIYNFDEEIGIYTPEKQKIITNLNQGVSELAFEVSRNPNLLYNLEPRRFEELIAHIFSNNGFQVELTKTTRDGGRDIIAIRSDMGIPSKYIIECKRYARDYPVCVDVVRALYGVQMAEGANKSIIATTSRFTQPAIDFATSSQQTQWHMDLRSYQDIVGWLGKLNS